MAAWSSTNYSCNSNPIFSGSPSFGQRSQKQPHLVRPMQQDSQSAFGKITMNYASTGAWKKSGIRQWTKTCERSYTQVGKRQLLARSIGLNKSSSLWVRKHESQ